MPSRRAVLAGATALLTGSSVSASTHSAAGATLTDRSWPMAGYDPAGTRYSPTVSGPVSDVEPVWTYDAPSWFRGASAPIRIGETLYATGKGVVALHVEDGTERFARRGPYTSGLAATDAEPYRSPTLAVTSTGGVYGINATGGIGIPGTDQGIGSERWHGPPYGEYRPTIDHTPTTNPVAHDGRVYAPVVGTNDIVAIKASDGSVRWRVTVEQDDVIAAGFGRPTISDGTLFVANWPGRVSAYDVEDGTQRWKQDRDDQMQLCTPVTDAGVIVTSRTGVALLDFDDGEPLWERDLDGNATGGTAAVTDDRVLLSDGNDEFHAIDLDTGESYWSREFTGESKPVVADGMVYAVEEKRLLRAFDVDSGAELFSYEPDQVPLSSPIIGDGRLYVTNRRRVLALGEQS